MPFVIPPFPRTPWTRRMHVGVLGYRAGIAPGAGLEHGDVGKQEEMHDDKVSKTAVTAGGLWIAAVVVWAVGGASFFAGAPRGLSVWLCFAACILAVGAATMTVRSYFARLFIVIRMLHGIEAEQESVMRSARGTR